MTPLIEFAHESVICHEDNRQRLPHFLCTQVRSLKFGRIWAFDISNHPNILEELRANAIDGLQRVMDRFYLWTPQDGIATHQCLLDELFNASAEDFESLIHTEQNLENISVLVGAIREFYGGVSGLRVLDFGCGPGLSVDTAHEQQVHIVGYDRCPKMRAAAASRGLEVIDTSEFTSMNAQVFDGVFASYVMHLSPARADLQKAVQLLRPRGVMAMNFHKDMCLAEVNEFMSTELDCQVIPLQARALRFNHGASNLYVRKA